MEETMYNSGTGISHELSHTSISRFTSSPSWLSWFLMYPLISNSFPPSLTTALQEGKREKHDGMKRREEEEGGEKGRGEQGEGKRGVKGEEGRRREEGRREEGRREGGKEGRREEGRAEEGRRGEGRRGEKR